jgi:hypothetical protein
VAADDPGYFLVYAGGTFYDFAMFTLSPWPSAIVQIDIEAFFTS